MLTVVVFVLTEPIVTCICVSDPSHRTLPISKVLFADLGLFHVRRPLRPDRVCERLFTQSEELLLINSNRSVSRVFRNLYDFNVGQSGLVFITVM